MRNRKLTILPSLSILLALGITWFPSHSVQATLNGKSGYLYWYYYTNESQASSARSSGYNYTNPQLMDPLICYGNLNECVLEVSLSTPTPPPNVAGLSIYYNVISGCPVGGTNFVRNEMKP